MTGKAQSLNFTLNVPPGISLNGSSSFSFNAIDKLVFENQQVYLSALSLFSVKKIPDFLHEIDSGSIKTFVEILLKKAPKTARSSLLTSGATSTEDEIANISYFARTLMPESVSNEAIGVTTGENIFQGFWAAVKSAERFRNAMQIDDHGGIVESGADAVRGISQSIGGAAYLGYRGTMIASNIQKADAAIQGTSKLGQAASALGLIGNVAFLIFYAMICVWAGYSFTKDWQFRIAMRAHEKNEESLFDFLMHKIEADPKTKLQKLQAYWKKLPAEKKEVRIEAFKKKLADAALSEFSELILKWQNELLKNGELSQKPLTEAQAREALKALFEFRNVDLQNQGVHAVYLTSLGLNENDLLGINFSVLELIGFKIEEAKRQAKKEAKFSRVVNEESLIAVKKAIHRGLGERLKQSVDPLVKESAQKELTILKEKIVLENSKNKWLHGALIAVGVLGIVSTILGFLNPVGGIVLTVITLLLVGTMMITDGSAMLEGWKIEGVIGSCDKNYLLVISLIIFIAVGVSIGLTLGLGLPLVPMILSCLIGAASLSLSGFAYYKMTQKEKVWLENHPDLMKFKELLKDIAQDSDTDEKVSALFKKLPKADRQSIRKKYKELSLKGRCNFKQLKYRQLDDHADFGRLYLIDEVCRKRLIEEKEHQLIIKAMKKTLKFFWGKWAKTKNVLDGQRALKLQSLFERISQKQLQDIQINLHEIEKDKEAYLRMKEDLWYVVKRHESGLDLKHAVDEVIQDGARSETDSEFQERDAISLSYRF